MENLSKEGRPPDRIESIEDLEFVERDPSRRYGRYDEVLGKGAYKTVYKGFDEEKGIEVAWNQVRIQDVLQQTKDLRRLYSELHLLKTLNHQNIIRFYHSWIDKQHNNMNFITEIFTSGSLRQFRRRHKHVKLRAIKHWSRQILQGLVYLHSHDPPIIHRDLKCDNIFINGNSGQVKIGDLGLAAVLRKTPSAHSVIGTPEFMAPELYEEKYNELVDIYSFGMCMLEMLTLEYPYSECTNAAQIYKKVTAGKGPEALNKIKDPESRAFVEKCLASASKRLSARQLLIDPFLQSDEDFEMFESSKSYEELRGGLHVIHEESQSQDVSANQSDEEDQANLGRFITPHATSFEKLRLVESISSKECAWRGMDFRIKGKKLNDKIILVVIRITNSRGGVRYIQFDFDVEADTAIIVANEMIRELNLSGEDVMTIASMIDEEMVTLVPDWRPGIDGEGIGGDDDDDSMTSTLENLDREDTRAERGTLDYFRIGSS